MSKLFPLAFPVSPVNAKCERFNNIEVAYNRGRKWKVITHIPIGDSQQYPYEIVSRKITPLGYACVSGGIGYYRFRVETRTPIRFLDNLFEFGTISKNWISVTEFPGIGDDWIEIPMDAYQLWYEAKNSSFWHKTRLEAGGILLQHTIKIP